MNERDHRFRNKEIAFNFLPCSLVMLAGMYFLGLSWVWSIAAVAAFWLALMVVTSLIECKGDLAEFLENWRFVLFEWPCDLIRGGLDWFSTSPLRSETLPGRQAQAKLLSDVLRIPIGDAELSLELSDAFFHPTDNPELNGEAMGLLVAPAPHNETWRARALECCRKLRQSSPERAGSARRSVTPLAAGPTTLYGKQ